MKKQIFTYTALALFTVTHSGYTMENDAAKERTINTQTAQFLIQACLDNNVVAVQRLLENKAYPNIRDNRNKTPLHYACERGSIEIVKLLIKYKADALLEDDTFKTPLFYAVRNSNHEILSFLLCTIQDSKTVDLKSLLENAIEKKDLESIKILLTYDAPQTSSTEEQLWLLAEENNDQQLFQLLIMSINEDHNCFYQNKTFDNISQKSNGPALEILLTHLKFIGINRTDYNNNKNTLLHKACERQNIKVIQLLLKHGAHPNLQNALGQAPLHIACEKKENIESVKLLLKYNANPNLQNGRIRTPLHIACGLSGTSTLVKTLLESGANPTIVNQENRLPLHLACFHKHHEKSIIFMLEYPQSLVPCGFIDSCHKMLKHIGFKNPNETINLHERGLELLVKAHSSIIKEKLLTVLWCVKQFLSNTKNTIPKGLLYTFVFPLLSSSQTLDTLLPNSMAVEVYLSENPQKCADEITQVMLYTEDQQNQTPIEIANSRNNTETCTTLNTYLNKYDKK